MNLRLLILLGATLGQRPDPRVHEGAQRTHIFVDGRVEGIVEDLERAQHLDPCLRQVEIAENKPMLAGAAAFELLAHRRERAGDEGVL